MPAETGAPAAEIEVTPEMIEAGEAAVKNSSLDGYEFWAGVPEHEMAALLALIYRAMSRRTALGV